MFKKTIIDFSQIDLHFPPIAILQNDGILRPSTKFERNSLFGKCGDQPHPNLWIRGDHGYAPQKAYSFKSLFSQSSPENRNEEQ